jgi:hypothetical protein
LIKDLTLAIPLLIPAAEELLEHQCNTFQQLILNLPTHVQQMMEDIEQLKDEGGAIATCIRAGHSISAWEDGSVKDDITFRRQR